MASRRGVGTDVVMKRRFRQLGGLPWTTYSLLPSGSRNENIGGTPSPKRKTSASREHADSTGRNVIVVGPRS